MNKKDRESGLPKRWDDDSLIALDATGGKAFQKFLTIVQTAANEFLKVQEPSTKVFLENFIETSKQHKDVVSLVLGAFGTEPLKQ